MADVFSSISYFIIDNYAKMIYMESLFTKGEIIAFKVVGLIIAFLAACIPIWLFYKSKKETKKLEERLEKEIIARKDLENKIAEENAKR